MKVGASISSAWLCGAALLFCIVAMHSTVQAEDSTTLRERQHERADQLRRQSRARAESRLSYETLPEQGAAVRTIDFYSLSVQAERIGAILREMARATQGVSASLPGIPTAPGAQTREIYGPGGPSVNSVQALLAYKLVVLGNPRLKVGAVTEDAKSVTAEIVTVKEGTVVERYLIDKQTGDWTPER